MQESEETCKEHYAAMKIRDIPNQTQEDALLAVQEVSQKKFQQIPDG
jgi:hypothetical protein